VVVVTIQKNLPIYTPAFEGLGLNNFFSSPSQVPLDTHHHHHYYYYNVKKSLLIEGI